MGRLNQKYAAVDSVALSRLTFIICFAAYFSTYLGRLNFSAAIPELIADGFMTKLQAGVIGTAFFACYGIGQLFCGFLSDKLSPFFMVFGGIFISAVANMAMPFGGSFLPMAVIWGINGLAQSMIWAAILRIISQVMVEEQRASACIHINLTVALGTLTAYLLSTVAIRLSGWRSVFITASLLMLAAAAFWLFGYFRIKPQLRLVNVEPPAKIAGTEKTRRLLPLLAVSGVLAMFIPTAIHGALKDGITTWVPTLLSEKFALSPDFAVLLSVVLPIFNVTGAYVINFLNKRLIHDDVLSAGAGFVICGVALTVLWLFGDVSPILSVVMLAVATSAMLGTNVQLITMVPLHFGKIGKSATVTGILNSSAYVGCASSMLIFGGLSEAIGWNGTILVWVGMSAAALLVCVIAARQWKKFKEQAL